jgi:hypothetical protein
MKKILFFTVLIISYLLIINNCYSQWLSDVRLTNAINPSQTSNNNGKCIISNGNVLHAVWYDMRSNYSIGIYYKRSTNGGVSWSADALISESVINGYYPTIAVSGSNVHVVCYYQDSYSKGIYYKKSPDGGLTWSAGIQLVSVENYAPGIGFPSVAASGSMVRIAYHVGISITSWEVYCISSSNGGSSWGPHVRLTTDGYESSFPSIAISGSSIIHIAWHDNRDGNGEIYYKRTTNGGISWSIDTRLTYEPALSGYPSIAINDSLSLNTVLIAWHDKRDGNSEIYYMRSLDGGITWAPYHRLTNNNADSEYPSLVTSYTTAHLVWHDIVDGNWEIYYSRSLSNGASWSTPARLTNNAAESSHPSIAISGSAVHVMWQDKRNGDFEIYYKRDPNGNSIGIKNISTEIPLNFSLYQNYPNPFNPTTNIRFSVPHPSEGGAYDVGLIIYDVLGRKIASLIIHEGLQPGTYEVNWDGSSYSSGIYYYTLSAGDASAPLSITRKMILLK